MRLVRRLRGRSAPLLVEASDGELYVIKLLDALLAPNSLFNECLGTELYRLFELPVPQWKPLLVSKHFVNQSLAAWVGNEREHGGICFGSSFLSGCQTQVFEFLPRTSFSCILESEMFWRALILDECANHCSHREAVFQRFLGDLL